MMGCGDEKVSVAFIKMLLWVERLYQLDDEQEKDSISYEATKFRDRDKIMIEVNSLKWTRAHTFNI
jgi:hypothetical protein